MKTIFCDDLCLNKLGCSLSDSLEMVFEKWIEENNLNEVNPIELAWLVNNVIELHMSRIYINKATELYKTDCNKEL